MSRVSTAQLLRLGDDLTLKERWIIETVARFGLMSHAQLALVLADMASEATAASQARAVRRTLAELTALGLLARLERRVGGVRAGSQGYVYYCGPAGQRLVAYWQGRGFTRGRFRPEPGSRYVRHRLAVSELFVELRRASGLDLLSFDPEPESWRRYVDGFGGQVVLKPDAFVRVGIGAYEDRYFIEVDLGSESRTVVARKLRAYLDYFNTGQEQAEGGVFPRVLLLTNSDVRRNALTEVSGRLPAEHWRLFTIGTLEKAVALIAGQLEDDAHDLEPSGGAI